VKWAVPHGCRIAHWCHTLPCFGSVVVSAECGGVTVSSRKARSGKGVRRCAKCAAIFKGKAQPKPARMP